MQQQGNLARTRERNCSHQVTWRENHTKCIYEFEKELFAPWVTKEYWERSRKRSGGNYNNELEKEDFPKLCVAWNTIHTKEEHEEEENEEKQTRWSKPCYAFFEGQCRFGRQCKYSHVKEYCARVMRARCYEPGGDRFRGPLRRYCE